MSKLGLLVRLEAKPGKETVVADFIKGALPLAIEEAYTKTWYAFQIDDSTFGIFDTFDNEESRKSHLGGKIAQALMANAPELLEKAPVIQPLSLLAVK